MRAKTTVERRFFLIDAFRLAALSSSLSYRAANGFFGNCLLPELLADWSLDEE